MKSGFGRYIIGGVLVTLGLLLLLSNAGILPLNLGIGSLWGFIADWWPLILVAVGLAGLISGGFRFRLWAVILLLLGVSFLLSNLDILDAGAFLWPALIVIAGVFILLGRRGRRRRRETVAVQPSDNNPAVILPGNASTAGTAGTPWRAVFGNVSERIATPDFQGGAAEAVFGSVELDFRDTALADNAAHLTVSVTFGELKLRVPPDWTVHCHDVKVTLGHVEQRHPPAPEQANPQLTITGAVTFGRLEITD